MKSFYLTVPAVLMVCMALQTGQLQLPASFCLWNPCEIRQVVSQPGEPAEAALPLALISEPGPQRETVNDGGLGHGEVAVTSSVGMSDSQAIGDRTPPP